MFEATPAKSEYVTRKELIDKALKEAGWRIAPFDPSKSLDHFHGCAIEEYPTANGPADYALCVAGNILGVVEGKKLSIGPQEVLRQAERYSKGVISNSFDFRGYKVPFLYSTNGKIIRFLDVRHELNVSRELAGFHTPGALVESLERDFETSCRTLLQLPNDNPRKGVPTSPRQCSSSESRRSGPKYPRTAPGERSSGNRPQ